MHENALTDYGVVQKQGYTLRVQFPRVAHVAAEAVSYGVRRLADALKRKQASALQRGTPAFREMRSLPLKFHPVSTAKPL